MEAGNGPEPNDASVTDEDPGTGSDFGAGQEDDFAAHDDNDDLVAHSDLAAHDDDPVAHNDIELDDLERWNNDANDTEENRPSQHVVHAVPKRRLFSSSDDEASENSKNVVKAKKPQHVSFNFDVWN